MSVPVELDPIDE